VPYDVAHLSVESIAVAENGVRTPIDEFLPLPPTKTSDYIERNREDGSAWRPRLLKSRVAFEPISLGREFGVPLAEFG
jgi:hypothetical protein